MAAEHRRPPAAYPDGKRFALTVVDDTDVATVANVEPLYSLLHQLGLRVTKTVWPMACPEGSRDFSSSQTLADEDYVRFVRTLQERGFEIGFHGATMEASRRDRTLAALARFRELFGADPRVHANHAQNRENLYWGLRRIDSPLLRFLYGRFGGIVPGYYQGEDPASPYWWGDECASRISYVRNLTYLDLNVLSINPSMPYHDPSRPLVRYWFSSADANDADDFVRVLSPAALDRLEDEGGVCIVATHFGKGYCVNGAVREDVRRVLADVSRRPGWFPPAGELLDWLKARRGSDRLPAGEWRRMQWRWAKDLAKRKLRAWRQRRRRRAG